LSTPNKVYDDDDGAHCCQVWSNDKVKYTLLFDLQNKEDALASKELPKSKINVECYQNLIASGVPRNPYSHQVTTISDRQFFAFVQKHIETDTCMPPKNNGSLDKMDYVWCQLPC